jgi:AraC-like DNA-binding protein
MIPPARIPWQISSFGRERRPPSIGYWWENAKRAPTDLAVFQLTLSGSMVFRDAQGDHAVPAGSAALFRYGEETAYGLLPGTTAVYETTWINCCGAGLGDHWDLLRLRHGPVLAVDESVLAAFHGLYALGERGADPVEMAPAMHAFVLLLDASLRRERLRAHGPVEAALEELIQHPTAAWSLKELAERHGVSREHLTRTFRSRQGTSPAAWLAQARLAKALHLLRETRLPVAEIARQAGFASTHTLARQVRRATGASPRTARGP